MEEKDNYGKLAGKVNFPQSRFIRQAFQKLVTPEEGEMLLALPTSTAELAKEFGMDEGAVAKKLDELVRKGVCMPLIKDGVERHLCVNNVIQVHDATIHATLNKRYEPVRDEIVPLWRNFRETEWLEMCRLRDNYTEAQLGRVAPMRGSVDTSLLLPYEDVAVIMEESPAIGVVDCPCRWLDVQEGKCDKPTFVCFSLTPNSVKYIVDREIGRQIGVDEAYEILEQCAEAGLVPLPGGAPRVRNLCNCCMDCCLMFRPAVKYGYRSPLPSRFRAEIDVDLCNGCQICVDRCPFGAIEMVKVANSKKLTASVDPETCMGCGACVIKCSPEAATLKLVRSEEHIPLTTGSA